MKINIDKNSGFCWGVVRTINMAEEELKNNSQLYCLGEIIHNPAEIKRLEALGLKTITREDFVNIPGSRVLIRAHGEPPETYELAKKYDITLIDATCPVVTKVQERVRNYDELGYQVVIFGKQHHAEVIGLLGQIKGKGVVIGSLQDIDRVDVTRNTVLFSQTTMDKSMFYKIRDELKKRVKKLVIDSFETQAVQFVAKDTICGQVSGRDVKLREFSKAHDVVLFVAGRSSSNGKVLYNICKAVNERTYLIEDETEIDFKWFEGANSIGISGATSTPHWLMEKVRNKLEENFELIKSHQ